jgi:hypothetical protein
MQQLESLQQQQHPHINGVFNQSMYSGDFEVFDHLFNYVISNCLLRSEYKSTSTATIPTATAATNCKIIHNITWYEFISNIISVYRG